MKCIHCGTENMHECNICVEGKMYGIIIKNDKKEKFKIIAYLCENCNTISLKKEDLNKFLTQ